ncbi:putative pollen-specific leucine-rich repeat extensin-like protein 3 [Iris pallida]|uniref:Pollen-specific leucine-rich repeat extensin-like protein 3 n=1 Tax=Iris pallida TaxID=29817 RepID=A0AAX6FS79_IRIPA|nr:putative pollen-specific leucine-rich repeat extensin-like protein 3 [Iris pallida]
MDRRCGNQIWGGRDLSIAGSILKVPLMSGKSKEEGDGGICPEGVQRRSRVNRAPMACCAGSGLWSDRFVSHSLFSLC